MDDLWYTIEYLRQRMEIAALVKGVSHPTVLMISQILDEAINKFYKVNKIKKAG